MTGHAPGFLWLKIGDDFYFGKFFAKNAHISHWQTFKL